MIAAGSWLRRLAPALLAAGVLLFANLAYGENLFQVKPFDPIPGLRAQPWHPTIPTAEADPSDTGVRRELLRHLPNNIQGFRLDGEIGSSEWPIFVTEAQSRGPVRFQVGYLAAISVMPEASVLTVWINDKVIGRTRIFAPTGVRASEFEVPAGILQYGFNSIRIGVEQRHRVDCSLDATYELWTQIDPTRTGLILSDDAGVSDFRDLAAIPTDAQGSLPIRAVIPGKTGIATIENVVRAVQSIVLAGRFEQPVIDYGSVASGQYGINLAIGTADELSNVFDLASYGPITGPRVNVQKATTRARTAIIVTGGNTKDVQAALAQLAIEHERNGSDAGLRAVSNYPAHRMHDSQRVRLRDLGVFSTEFSGRYFRASFNIETAPDLYAADSAGAFLILDGGYVAGLLSNSQVMITINGRDVASLNLATKSGGIIQRSEIPLPFGSLRPGLNRVEVKALVPMDSDASCDPLAAIEGKKRFLLLDSSELVLPAMARIARMPDLAVTSSGAFPFSLKGIHPKLYVPTPDRLTMGAATTLAARLAVSAGKPIDFQVTLTAPAPGSGPTLAVAAARSFSAAQIAAAGLDPEAIRAAWEARAESGPRKAPAIGEVEAAVRQRVALRRNVPAACHMRYVPPVTASGSAALPNAPVAAPAPQDVVGALNSDSQLLDRWREKIGASWGMPSLSGAAAWANAWSDYAVNAMHDGVSGIFGTPDRSPRISAESSLIIAQNISGRSINDVWTYVIAPNSEILGESIACLVDPRVWRQVDGRVSFLDASKGEITHFAAQDTQFIQTQPLTPSNIRLIAASWLSLNEGAYVGLALLVSIILSVSTLTLLRNVGRRSS